MPNIHHLRNLSCNIDSQTVIFYVLVKCFGLFCQSSKLKDRLHALDYYYTVVLYSMSGTRLPVCINLYLCWQCKCTASGWVSVCDIANYPGNRWFTSFVDIIYTSDCLTPLSVPSRTLGRHNNKISVMIKT